MTTDELKLRTKRFALRCYRLADELPKTASGRALAGQLSRCGPSVGANYRSACRGKSKKDFVMKLAIAVEEADESCYWLELVIEASFVKESLVSDLLKEANELTAILSAALRTSRASLEK